MVEVAAPAVAGDFDEGAAAGVFEVAEFGGDEVEVVELHEACGIAGCAHDFEAGAVVLVAPDVFVGEADAEFFFFDGAEDCLDHFLSPGGVCVGFWRGITPILTFPRQGGRDKMQLFVTSICWLGDARPFDRLRVSGGWIPRLRGNDGWVG